MLALFLPCVVSLGSCVHNSIIFMIIGPLIGFGIILHILKTEVTSPHAYDAHQYCIQFQICVFIAGDIFAI